MGALLRCSHITIWTDVDGVYSADPRKVGRRVLVQRAEDWNSEGEGGKHGRALGFRK